MSTTETLLAVSAVLNIALVTDLLCAPLRAKHCETCDERKRADRLANILGWEEDA